MAGIILLEAVESLQPNHGTQARPATERTVSLVDLGKQLLEASRMGNTEEVRRLMTSGAPFTSDWLGTSPLHMAAQFGHLNTAEALIRAGISRDARTKVDRTPLHVAAQEGHAEIVDLLVKSGTDIEARDMLKMTPLHWAVERGHLQVVELLLENGADVNSTSKFDKTPATVAFDNGRLDIVQMLTCGDLAKRLALEETDASAHLIAVEQHQHQQHMDEMGEEEGEMEQHHHHQQQQHHHHEEVEYVQEEPVDEEDDIEDLSGSAGVVMQQQQADEEEEEDDNIVLCTAADAADQPPTTLYTPVKSATRRATPTPHRVYRHRKPSEKAETTNNTSVLATLAALAETMGPLNSGNTAETIRWLEQHGIQMLPGDNSTIISSAIESGQTISLTDAGKLALGWVKKPNSSKRGSAGLTLEQRIGVADMSNQKVFTLVADQSQIVGGDVNGPILVTMTESGLDSPDQVVSLTLNSADEAEVETPPVAKRPKKQSESSEVEEDVTKMDRDQLTRLLEDAQRKAKEFEEQLRVKQHEADEYKKKLESIASSSSSPSKK